ncbi:MAG: N-acetylmuramoyl-L-alanine amidase [Clostridia bacterium]|nr:N-acetylmuramoyl-L-alanine amidase [Clostridia bacterium]
MKLVKRILLLLIIAALTVVPMIPVSGAAFTGDDKIIVVLDPGHGGHDPGAVGIQTEAYYNLTVAHIIREKLEKNGNFVVHMTRSTADKFLTLAERLYFADSVNADIAISVHFNSCTVDTISGVEVYGSVLDKFYPEELAQKIVTGVANASGLPNRGTFRKYDYGTVPYYWSEEYQWDIPGDSSVGGLSDYYGVITWGAKFGIPCLIVEHAYLSHPTDKTLIENHDVLVAMGEAHADAIIDYYTNHTHKYGKTVVDAPVTCFSAGKKSVHCTVCGHRKNVTSVAAAPDPDKHIWLVDGTETPATCESDGYAKYYCRYTHNLNDKGCTQFDVHYTEKTTKAYGHDYEVTYHRDVTHTEDGITTYTCSRCSDSYSDTVTAEGHSYSLTDHADPTCTENGHDTYTCNACNESYSDIIPMTGHSFNTTSRTDPTCEEDGSEHHVCSTCKFEEDVTIPAIGHDFKIYSDIQPNCTEEGLRTLECSICKYKKDEPKEKSDHSFSIVSELAPTCDTKGETHKNCIVCGVEETVISEPLGHTYEILSETSPTCDTEGSVSKKCTVCGIFITEKVPATGHTYDEGTVIKAPGLFFAGSAEYKCLTDPSHTKTEALTRLTLSQYIEQSTAGFILLCVIAVIILGGIAVFVIMLIKAKKKSHSHRKHSKQPPIIKITSDTQSKSEETEGSSIEK